MRFILNTITLVSISFLSVVLIIIGFLLQANFIPLQVFNSISREELLSYQKEYAINYPLGIGLFYLGFSVLILIIILLTFKLPNSRRNKKLNSKV